MSASLRSGQYRSLFDDLPPLVVDEQTLHAVGPRGRAVRPRRERGRRRRARRGVAVLRAVPGPRHHRRSLAAGAPQRARADPQLPCSAGEPRGRLRGRPGGLAVSLSQGRSRPAAAVALGVRRAAQPRGHRAGRRSAQRRAPVRQPDAGGVHQPAQPPRRAAARRRRGRRLRAGAARGHLALPARDPA